MQKGKELFQSKKIAAIIPAYKPREATYALIESLLKWYDEISVVLIDDCTPQISDSYYVINKIRKLSQQDSRLTYLRTPVNKLKAGALNFGLAYLWALPEKPQVVVTFDDDVRITPTTLYEMVHELYSKPRLGAVCSQTRVINKDVNILTRLQALEYQSFTVTKVADNGFLKGPLVMQGMLTAFRMRAIQQVKGFTPGHLIEDYDITVRMKKKGWKVAIAKDAQAWTDVPEDFSSLWKQRIRWGYGGLQVLQEYGNHVTIVFQDLLGHFMFVMLFLLVGLSFLFTSDGSGFPYLPYMLVIVATGQFILSFIFNYIIIRSYDERDWKDWVLKMSIIPEFLYCNALSLMLLGSYLYFIYNNTVGKIAKRFKFFVKPYRLGLRGFEKLGYSLAWGTRAD